MKAVTEFFAYKLIKGNTAKAALLADNKTPEEVEQGLGEQFKMEGDKLKHFVNAMQVAEDNAEKLGRVLVFKIEEGENIPAKAVKVEEHHYVPEFAKAAKGVATKDSKKDSGKKGGKGKKGPKPSPWGISPEEQAAKKAASRKASQKS